MSRQGRKQHSACPLPPLQNKLTLTHHLRERGKGKESQREKGICSLAYSYISSLQRRKAEGAASATLQAVTLFPVNMVWATLRSQFITYTYNSWALLKTGCAKHTYASDLYIKTFISDLYIKACIFHRTNLTRRDSTKAGKRFLRKCHLLHC